MQFKCITEINEVLPNIPKERMQVLIAKTDKVEARIKFLEEERFYLKLGIPRNYDEVEIIDEKVGECLGILHQIISEVRFLNYSVQHGMSVSLN